MYGVKQTSRSWHKHVVTGVKSLDFEWRRTDSCVSTVDRLKRKYVSVISEVHEAYMFAVGRDKKCGRFCEDLDDLVRITNLGDPGCH